MSLSNAERQKKWRDKHTSYHAELIELKKKSEEARLMLEILRKGDENMYRELKHEAERLRKVRNA